MLGLGLFGLQPQVDFIEGRQRLPGIDARTDLRQSL
jgi:hypothetical protein